MAELTGWFSKKSNQLVLLGATAVLGFTGVLIYIKRQENLFNEINAAISKPVDKLSSGIHGDWRDLYDGDFWNPKVFLARKDIKPATIDRIAASKYAQQIYDADGVINAITSDPEKVTAVLNKLSNRADLAQVADRFQSLYNESLVDFIKRNFEGSVVSKNYVKDFYNVIQNLPV